MATRMDQSLAEFEEAFVEEIYEDRRKREFVQRRAVVRAHQRRIDRVHKHGTLRFIALMVTLAATVVGTTIGMFQLLLLVMA